MNTIKFNDETLYYEGNIDLLQKRKVYIAGTRRASPYGKWVSHELANHQDCVVTMLNEGCDSAAIMGALFDGAPIVVLATPLDTTFPRSCKSIRERVLERGGLIVSLFEEGFEVKQSNFVVARELAVRLSEAVVITESTDKGGTMLAAELAKQYEKPLYAVPGNINQPTARGTNLLIANGARPVLDITEVF